VTQPVDQTPPFLCLHAGCGPHTPGSFDLRSATSTADCSSEPSWCTRNSKTWAEGQILQPRQVACCLRVPAIVQRRSVVESATCGHTLCPIPAYPDPMQTPLECSIPWLDRDSSRIWSAGGDPCVSHRAELFDRRGGETGDAHACDLGLSS
jgi:hypothetical protein